MSAVIYCRVSTTQQEEEGNSLENQEQRCKLYCEMKNLTVKDVFKDVKSGRKRDNRDGLTSAIAKLEKGDKLVIVALSRMSRSLKDTFKLIEEFKEKGFDLVSLQEEINTSTAMGKMIFTIFAALNQFESEQLGERTRAGLKFKIDNGEDLGRPRYGMKYVDKKLVRCITEQNTIKIIKKQRKLGKSISEIIKHLEENDRKPRTKCISILFQEFSKEVRPNEILPNNQLFKFLIKNKFNFLLVNGVIWVYHFLTNELWLWYSSGERAVKQTSPNAGRLYYACDKGDCSFFRWKKIPNLVREKPNISRSPNKKLGWSSSEKRTPFSRRNY